MVWKFGTLEIADVAVIAIYFFVVILVGVIVGASLFASNIGSSHFVGLAGSGSAGGIAVANFEITGAFSLIILGWIFVPVYTRSGVSLISLYELPLIHQVFTMPEYLYKRFGGTRLQTYLTCMALILYITTKISADLYAGYIFIDQALGLNLYISVIILLCISALFTILGGLTAVIWTDFMQTILMVVGAMYLMIVSFVKIGGFDRMVEQYFNAIPNTTRSGPGRGNSTTYAECGIPGKDSFHFLHSVDDPVLPWTGVIFGLTISNLWYWCTDQVIVQRTLSAKNISHAKAACIMSAALKLLPLWLLVFPGMISRIIFPDEVGCSDPQVCMSVCQKPSGCSDIAFPKLVLALLPAGAKGLMLAVMLASLVSSLTSIFNSSSTLFTMDLWRRFRPASGTAELMIVSRISTLVLVGISIAWIPIVKSNSELFHYIQSVTSYLAPPVCVVYLMAIFWTRCNEKGAFSAMMIGLVVGLIRFIWESALPKSTSHCVDAGSNQNGNWARAIIENVHYLHFSIILFVICAATAWVVSMLTEPLPERYTRGLTYWSLYDKLEETSNVQVNEDVQSHSSKSDVVTVTESDPESLETATKKAAWYVRIAYWICGIESTTSKQSPANVIPSTDTDLKEDPKWALTNDLLAIALIGLITGLWLFFA